MKVIGRLGDLVIYEEEVSGPSSYTTGGAPITIDVGEVVSVISASISGGYMTSAADAKVDGNTVTLKIYEFNYPATAEGPAKEVAAGADLSGETIKIVFLGK